MNTLTRKDAFLTSDYRDTVFLLDELEFAMPKKQLAQITLLHNSGTSFQEIAKVVKRDPYEVIIALLHQVRRGKSMRPFAFINNGRDKND